MFKNSKLHAQVRALFPILVVLYIPALVMLFIIVLVSFHTDEPIKTYTSDPAALMGADPFVGVLSNIGVLFWSASAAICFFSFAVLRNNVNTVKLSGFFLFSGLITSFLLLDDLFLFHEKIFPKYLHVNENVTFYAYAIIILLYIVRFRMSILRTHYILLLLAFGFFGLSVIVDRLQHRTSLPWHHLFEDGSKLFGIVSWFGYFVSVCFNAMKSVIIQQGESIK